MVKDLVKNLSSDNEELQMLCASAIFKVLGFLSSALHSSLKSILVKTEILLFGLKPFTETNT